MLVDVIGPVAVIVDVIDPVLVDVIVAVDVIGPVIVAVHVNVNSPVEVIDPVDERERSALDRRRAGVQPGSIGSGSDRAHRCRF